MAKKRRKKRVFKIKNIIIILFILVLFCGFFYYCLNMPIKNIYISGNNIVSDEEILELGKIEDYPSFMLTSSSMIRSSILKNKYISDVIVKKKYGNVIELEIIEYRIVASDVDGNVILANGLRLENNYIVTDIPRLISYVSEDVIKDFSMKFDKLDSNILREISEVEYSPTSVDDKRFLLYMNDGNFVYVTLTKIEKLNKYNDIKDELMGRIGTIYLDSGDYVEIRG